MSFIDQPKIQLSDTGVRDAFGNMRVSSPYTLFASMLLHDSSALKWSESVTGVGASSAFVTNQSSVLLTVPSSISSSVIRQTRQWFPYQPGKSQKILCTFVLGTGGTGITKRVGLFNDTNGLFLIQDGTTLGVGLRTYTSGAAVDTVVNQSSWNVDKLDGTGDSGITLDVTKTNILVIDFQWLGVGRVRFGFSIDGSVYYVHEILNANVNTVPYIQTPNLPVRFEIRNSGAGATNSMRQICCSVDSEGGTQDLGIHRSITRGSTGLTTLNDTDLYPLIAFRLKSGHFGNGVSNIKVSISCTTTALFEYQLLVNPTVTGTAFSYTSLSNSGIEYDTSTTSATKVSAPEIILDCGLDSVGTVSTISPSDFNLGSTVGGTSDVVVLAVRRLTGTTETFYANLVLKENHC